MNRDEKLDRKGYQNYGDQTFSVLYALITLVDLKEAVNDVKEEDFKYYYEAHLRKVFVLVSLKLHLHSWILKFEGVLALVIMSVSILALKESSPNDSHQTIFLLLQLLLFTCLLALLIHRRSSTIPWSQLLLLALLPYAW